MPGLLAGNQHVLSLALDAPTVRSAGRLSQVFPTAEEALLPIINHSGPLSAKLVKGAVLKTYKGFPHYMPTTNAAEFNADLLAFIKGEMAVSA